MLTYTYQKIFTEGGGEGFVNMHISYDCHSLSHI
jgi:hypothetical protein